VNIRSSRRTRLASAVPGRNLKTYLASSDERAQTSNHQTHDEERQGRQNVNPSRGFTSGRRGQHNEESENDQRCGDKKEPQGNEAHRSPFNSPIIIPSRGKPSD